VVAGRGPARRPPVRLIASALTFRGLHAPFRAS
jgi:hypothetical protein